MLIILFLHVGVRNGHINSSPIQRLLPVEEVRQGLGEGGTNLRTTSFTVNGCYTAQ